MSNLYDQHEHLNEAKIACVNDSQCIGIYEDSCDKDGPFMLLKSGFLTSVSGTNCIYKKTTYSKLIYLYMALQGIYLHISCLGENE